MPSVLVGSSALAIMGIIGGIGGWAAFRSKTAALVGCIFLSYAWHVLVMP